MFLLPPKRDEKVFLFKDLSDYDYYEKLLKWGLIIEKEKDVFKQKLFKYQLFDTKIIVNCLIVGYIPYPKERPFETMVIEIDGQFHKIMPKYFKQMQKIKNV